MQEIVVAICIGLALLWVYRHLVGALGNKHRCCGCHGCDNRPTCDPKKQEHSQQREIELRLKNKP